MCTDLHMSIDDNGIGLFSCSCTFFFFLQINLVASDLGLFCPVSFLTFRASYLLVMVCRKWIATINTYFFIVLMIVIHRLPSSHASTFPASHLASFPQQPFLPLGMASCRMVCHVLFRSPSAIFSLAVPTLLHMPSNP